MEKKIYISGLYTKEGALLIPGEIPGTMPNLPKKNLPKKKAGDTRPPCGNPLHKVNKCTHLADQENRNALPISTLSLAP